MNLRNLQIAVCGRADLRSIWWTQRRFRVPHGFARPVFVEQTMGVFPDSRELTTDNFVLLATTHGWSRPFRPAFLNSQD
jgi:hypothetical protein